MSEVRVERLLRKWVVDSEGEKVGRVEELLAADENGECRILEYHLGSYGTLEAIGAMGRFGAAFVRFVSNRSHEGYAVRWDRMDLSDPDHPRLTCRRAELPRL
jgi:sporulation protein YlmC with PRC-barrel domain